MSDFCACRSKGPVKGTLGGQTVCSKCNKSREPSSAAEAAHLPDIADEPQTVPEHIDDSPMPTGTDEIDDDNEPTVVPGEMRKLRFPPIDPADVNDRTGIVLAEVCDERFRQEVLKSQGRFPHTCADKEIGPLSKLAILAEEFGELARAVVESQDLCTDKYHTDALDATKKELTQIAAVCVAWLESL